MKKMFLFLVVSIIASISWANSFQIENFNFKIISSRTLEVSAADKSITEADIPASVTYNETNYVVTDISEGGFANCSNLTSITIPNSVSHIGDLAFSYCTSLKVIKLFVEGRHLIGEDNDDDSNDDDDESGVIVPPCSWCGGVVKIAARNFAGQEAPTDIFYGSRAKVTTVILGDGVTYIPEALCQSMFSLTSVDIPNSVTSIGEEAFANCSSLASITLPDNLTSIGERAFYNCTSLESITIPDSVTNIEDYAFERCTSICSVYIGKNVVNIGEGAFDCCYALKNCTWNATKCGDFLPYNKSPFSHISSQITSFTFGEAVEIIPANLCNRMYKLQSIEIPNSVTIIGDSAFYYCNTLTSVKISNSITSIGDCAFNRCEELTSITIPSSVTSIGAKAFTSLNLEEIYCYPITPPAVDSTSFYCNYSTATLYVPCDSKEVYEEHPIFGEFEKIRGIDGCGEYVTTHIYDTICQGEVYEFGGCLYDATGTYTSTIDLIPTYLYLTVLPSPTVTITVEANDSYIWHDEVYTESGEYKYVTVAANGCDSIEVLYLTIIPSDNPDITREQQIFYTSSDGNIVNPTNPNGFGANIISNTYENGQGIITFDGPVTSIGQEAFYACTSLTSISIPNSVTTIGHLAFTGCSSLTSITVPKSVTDIGKSQVGETYRGPVFTYCPALTSIVVEEGNPIYDSRDNCNAIIQTATNTLIAGCQNTTIPNSVTSIGDYAFNGCSSLTSITIPNHITNIQSNPFLSCSSLATIVVESGNPIYDSRDNCNAIIESTTNVLLVGCQNTTIPNSVTSIGGLAFYGCSSLTVIAIPENVTSIGSSAFDGCSSLTSITIPNSVTSIGDYAFEWCSSLTSINIPENVTSIGENAFDGCSSLTSINIPENVTSIGDGAFWGCSSLNAIYCYIVTPIQITPSTFGNSYNKAILYVPCESLDAYLADKVWERFDNIQCIGDEIPKVGNSIYYTSSDGNIVNPYKIDGFDAKILSNTYENGRGTITFGGLVGSIRDSAFYSCHRLTSITIPKYVDEIGAYAFYECSLLYSITCLETTPPSALDSSRPKQYSFQNYDATIYVPCEALEAYKEHRVWSKFADIQCIEEEQPQADNLYYRYVMNADNTVLSETLLTQESFDKFTTVSLKGDQQWTLSKSYGAIMNGYSINMTHPNEDWLISPALDLAGKDNAILSFDHCFGPASSIPTTEAEKAQYTIWVSNDFTGDVQSATWTQLNGMMYGTTVWQYVSSGNIEIPANYLTENCRVAWKYVCEDASAQWEIKNVLVTIPTNQVEVVAGENKYSGDIIIPVTTIFNGQKCDVVGIAEEAFSGCSTLTSITIPNSVKYIGESAFRGCNALEKTNFMGEIADWCDIKFGGAYANPIMLSHNFYINNQEITELIIPNTVDSISAYAFDFCKSFTSITIPNSVTFIGKYAFELCSNVKSIFIPKSVKCIQEAAFTGGVNLQSMIVEEGNPMYDSRDNCNAIIETESNTLIAGCSVTNMPKSVIHIGAYAFSYQYLLNSIEVPDGIIAIGDNAYYGCGNATSIFIPNSVSHIGYWALYACNSLNSIVVEEGNSVYDSRNNCNAIIETATNSLIVACQNTVIPEGVTNIGEHAFFNCDALINSNALTSIVLPNTIESIEAFAFSMCSSLDTIYCYAITPPAINQYSFDNYNATLYVPCGSLEAYKAHEVWSQFSNIDCITSNKVETDTVVIDASTSSVTITWPTETGADSYTIIIKKDGEIVCTLTFDSEGRLLNIAFAPGRDGNHPARYAEQAANGYRFTVTGLEEGTNYTYDITAKDAADNVLQTYSGEFNTQSDMPTDVDNFDTSTNNVQKLLRNGQLIILRDGVEYNVMGQEL